ncbi:PREDICTED: uncharacterized protein LOC109207324 [Nicotiana attenuata]|uniref:uncharacterized protein LOC109207324 n=1 Tax=Nicotiana attenuata TaxID=49451 RepID=UPI000905199E|nr:PREDICTED: uncharacterized protein LOC109207324 [Nicotiana attenuata]
MEDKNLIMQNGPYPFNSRPMVLKYWDPNFQMKDESMRIVPIWINLPGLPIQCWAEEHLGRIASLLGKPICTDRLTAECERVSYARILVDMDITQPMPDEFCVEIPDRSWMQSVEYEWTPKLCLDCNKFGHGTGECQQATQQEEEPMKHKRRRMKRVRMAWKPKVTAEENNNTITLQQDNHTEEPVLEIQVDNRGKQAVVIQGAAGKTNQKDINYEELAIRNAFAPLTILERPSNERQQGHNSSTKALDGQQGQTSSIKAGQMRELKKFLLMNKVDMIAVLETRVKRHRMQNIHRKIGVEWQLKDNYEHAPNGRIWLIWKEANVHVTTLESTDQMIHCLVKDKNSSFTSYITFVYGLHTTQQRIPLWRSLRNIQYNGPWLIIGDFSSVLNVDDRVNGVPVNQAEMIDFQNCLEDIGVGQITKRGSRFSWSNKRDAEIRIYSHIDWAFGNADWFNTYNGVEPIYMLPGCSDHTPVLINTKVVKVK